MHSSVSGRYVAAAVLASALFFLASSVEAQSARARVDAMNDEAMDAYHRLDLDRAQSLLDQALALANREHVGGAELARVHRSLGVIAVAGRSDRAAGVQSFMRAIEADPSIELDPLTSTPEVQSAFDTARARSSAGGRSTTPTPTPTPAPPSAPECAAGESCSSTSTPAVSGEPAQCTDDGACGDDERCADGTCVSRFNRPRFFVQAGGVFGMFRATSGMRADDSPPSGGDPAIYASYIMGGAPGCDAPTGEYCVRVTKTGLAPVLGVRVGIGYWLAPRVAIAVTVRAGLGGGTSPLSYFLASFRGQVMLTSPDVSRFSLSMTLGPSLGQVQFRPKQRSTTPGVTVARPWVRDGLISVQIGAIASYRFLDHFGLFLQAEANVFFPDIAIGAEGTGGIEVSF